MGSIELSLECFQSYQEKTTFTFSTGINFIIGSNDSGKSAVFRAISCLVTNPIGVKDSYISKGEDTARITLVLDGVSTSMWLSHKGSTRYEHDGIFYDRVNRDGIVDIVPGYPIKLDDSGGVVGMMDEWSVMFPFGRSPTQMFRLFEDMFGIRDTSSIIKGFGARTTELKREIAQKHKDKEVVLRRRESISRVLSGIDVDLLNRYKVILNQNPVLIGRLNGILLRSRGLLSELPTIEEYDMPLGRIERLYYCRGVLERSVKLSDLWDFDFNRVLYLETLNRLLLRSRGLLSELPVVKGYDISLDRVEMLVSSYKSLQMKLVEIAGIDGKLVLLEESIKSLREGLLEYRVCPVCGVGDVV